MSDCDLCVYTNYDGDMPEFQTETISKARKDYKCCECGDPIPKGTLYERVTGKWHESIDTYRTCLACKEIREAFFCDGWIYTQMWENFGEYFEHLTTGCLSKLTTAAAKKKLTDEWRQWKDL